MMWDRQGATGGGAGRAAPKDILVVDYARESAWAVARKLSNAGYTVRVANDAALGLIDILERTPDLLLLDSMPAIRSDQLLTYLHLHGYPGLPIIVMNTSCNAQASHKLGATLVVPQQLETNELLSAVARLIA